MATGGLKTINIATLCLIVTDTHICLGMKKVRFGKGKWNGFGGRVQKGETIRKAAIRELEEESGLTTHARDLKKVSCITFHFDGVPTFEVHSFIVRFWSGELSESDEMKPRWHPLGRIPYSRMWKADREWIPRVLSGEKIRGKIYFNTDGSVVERLNLRRVKKL